MKTDQGGWMQRSPKCLFLKQPLKDWSLRRTEINPYVTYHLDESTVIFKGIRSNFSFLFYFSMKFIQANRIAPDGTPHFVAFHFAYIP